MKPTANIDPRRLPKTVTRALHHSFVVCLVTAARVASVEEHFASLVEAASATWPIAALRYHEFMGAALHATDAQFDADPKQGMQAGDNE